MSKFRLNCSLTIVCRGVGHITAVDNLIDNVRKLVGLVEHQTRTRHLIQPEFGHFHVQHLVVVLRIRRGRGQQLLLLLL